MTVLYKGKFPDPIRDPLATFIVVHDARAVANYVKRRYTILFSAELPQVSRCISIHNIIFASLIRGFLRAEIYHGQQQQWATRTRS